MIRRRIPALLAVLCAGALAPPALAAEAERYTPLPRALFSDLRSPDAQDSGSPEARHSVAKPLPHPPSPLLRQPTHDELP
jgi:hypothetical protein